MTTTVINEVLRRGYLLDPHDGRCAGQHNVVVLQTRNAGEQTWLPATVAWGPAALLSLDGAWEVADAILEAVRLGEELEANRFPALEVT